MLNVSKNAALQIRWRKKIMEEKKKKKKKLFEIVNKQHDYLFGWANGGMAWIQHSCVNKT